MNVIINIPDGLATELISTAKHNGEEIEAHITRVLSDYVWPVEPQPVSDDAVAEAVEEPAVPEQVEKVVKEKAAPLTNDTTTVFNTKKNTKEKGAPLYCKKETNSWKIL